MISTTKYDNFRKIVDIGSLFALNFVKSYLVENVGTAYISHLVCPYLCLT